MGLCLLLAYHFIYILFRRKVDDMGRLFSPSRSVYILFRRKVNGAGRLFSPLRLPAFLTGQGEFVLSPPGFCHIILFMTRSKSLIKILSIIFLAAYVAAIVIITLTNRQPTINSQAETQLFWSYAKWFSGEATYGLEIFQNILLFIPFGLLFALALDIRKISPKILIVILSGLALSIFVELYQLFSHFGLFEFDDMFDNTLGAAIGAFAFMLISKLIARAGCKKILMFIFRIVVLAGCLIAGIMVVVITGHSESSGTLMQEFAFQVESANRSKDELTLNGYFFINEETAGARECSVSLRPSASDNSHSSSDAAGETDLATYDLETTSAIPRSDVNNYFLCEYDYTNCGFTAKIDSAAIKENVQYEVLIKVDGIYFSTGVYIKNTSIEFVPDSEKVDLEVSETDLEKITKDGRLMCSRKDYGCYVYQYKGALYWIADENFDFESDGSTYVQYQLWTTQPEKLPAVRVENNWDWDNIGFNFEDQEITGNMNCGRYRVARKELPSEYSITAIVTGYHDFTWIWNCYFRPVHEF